MSKAGKNSSEGDEYQLQVALHWCINLLTQDSINYIVTDIITIPTDSDNKKVEVDDIFIAYKDKKRVFIQAKKNETNYENWKLNNRVLKEEIQKAYQQYIDNNPEDKIYFYSASPFGKFQKVVKDINKDKLYSTYLISAQNIKDTVITISKIIKETEEETFNFLLSINFGSTKTIEEWNQDNLERLNPLVINPKQAKNQLEFILKNHQIGENEIPNKLTKKYLKKELEKENLILTSKYKEKKILKEFQTASKVGRNKDYSINGKSLVQNDKQNIINKLETSNSSIIVTDKPGNGKSCLLDSIASHFENDSKFALLFLKGDEFSKVANDKEFSKKYNMPKDIVEKIAILSKLKKVIVIIDSLDVIALNKEYGTLQYFLSIIDRLKGVDNISLLIASRIFDLKYEPRLRDRKWDTKIELQEFCFEEDIVPLLKELNIPFDKINTRLKQLLIIPQNLKLFVQIYDKIPYSNISTEYDLFNHFIEEIIIKDELLGTNALKFLGDIANYCIKNRTLNMPNTYPQKEKELLQRLKSQDIIQLEKNSIKFTHQILLDIFIVHDSIGKDEDLLTFIISRTQFPFIRPIVRSYFFILYSMGFQLFQKQIIKTLSNIEVSYHIKRLLIESFAELEFSENNFKLLQKIYRHDKYLLERFFNVIKDFNWFEAIKSKLLPIFLDEDEKIKWNRLLLYKTDKFINTHTKEMINYYNALINENIDKESLFPIFLSLTKLDNLNVKEIYNILEYSLKVDPNEYLFGEVLSKYIDQINNGDELLWQYITKDINEEELNKYNIKINCEDHNFYRNNFFQERLNKSENLLTKAFYAIEKWSITIYGSFLDSCVSYKKKHNKSDMIRGTRASGFFNILEEAIIYQATYKTNWWKEFEKKLLKSKELLFTYILIQIYEKDITSNINGIISILTNKKFLDNGYIKDEIFPLLNKSFPYLENKTQDKIQSILLTINDDKDYIEEHDLYYKKDIYEYLLYIPAYLRIEEIQNYINRYKKEFGLIRKSPSFTSGGLVRSPIKKEEFDVLSTKYIIKLFDHYNNPINGSDSEYTDRGYVGGKSEVSRTFYNIVLQNPKKYLYLIDIFNTDKSYKKYFNSFIEAISNYIEHIDGNLSFGQNIEINTTTNTFELANILLYQIERNINNLDERTIIKALKACSYVLKDENFIFRITFLLYPLAINKNRYIYEYEDNDDKDIDTLNSISGIIGGTVIKLANGYLANNKLLPKILEAFLIKLSKDGMNSAKASILENLPYLISQNKTLGWKVFDNIIQDPIPKILENTYNCLYYNYHKDFSKVSKYLNLFNRNYLHIDECAEIIGRIYGLAYIDKNISFDELLIKIQNSSNDKIIDGVISILTDESNFKNYNKLCKNTLIIFLENSELNADIVYKIETLFFNTKNFKYISLNLVNSIISNLSSKQNRYRDINALFEWLEFFAKKYNVVDSLEITKDLVSKIEELNFDDLYSSDKILSYLLILLEEADESDDEDLVKEVLDIQERLFKLNVQTDKLYEEYT